MRNTAETLFITGGEIEVIFHTSDRERILGDIIRERLGKDCEDLFYHIITANAEKQVHGDDYERIADGYRTMLLETVEELDEALLLFRKPRLSRKGLQQILQNCRNNIYNNL